MDSFRLSVCPSVCLSVLHQNGLAYHTFSSTKCLCEISTVASNGWGVYKLRDVLSNLPCSCSNKGCHNCFLPVKTIPPSAKKLSPWTLFLRRLPLPRSGNSGRVAAANKGVTMVSTEICASGSSRHHRYPICFRPPKNLLLILYAANARSICIFIMVPPVRKGAVSFGFLRPSVRTSVCLSVRRVHSE